MTSTTKTILIVDDIKDITDSLQRFLSGSEMYTVLTANSGQEALSLLEENTPDLILTDINMPGLSGGALVSQLRVDPRFATTPVVFMTGMVTNEEVDIGNGRIGGHSYIAKPFNLRKLRDTIESHIKFNAETT